MTTRPLTLNGLHRAYVAGAIANQIATLLLERGKGLTPPALRRDLQANVEILEECIASIGPDELAPTTMRQLELAIRQAEAKIEWLEQQAEAAGK